MCRPLCLLTPGSIPVLADILQFSKVLTFTFCEDNKEDKKKEESVPVLNPILTAPEPPPIKRYVLSYSAERHSNNIVRPTGIMEETKGMIQILSYHWTLTEARKNKRKSKAHKL